MKVCQLSQNGGNTLKMLYMSKYSSPSEVFFLVLMIGKNPFSPMVCKVSLY